MFAAKTQYRDMLLFNACTDPYINDRNELCVDATGCDGVIYTFNENDSETLFKIVRHKIIGKSERLKHIWVDPEDV